MLSAKLTEEVDPGVVTTHDAQTAYERVLKYAGASLSPDAVDIRYMTEVKDSLALYYGSNTSNGIAGMIDIVADQGAYAIGTSSRSSSFDTDRDGIPDEWETANGLNSNNANDANKTTIDTEGWYTNLEVYLHSVCRNKVRPAVNGGLNDVKHYWPGHYLENGTYVKPANLPSGIANVTVAEVVSSEYYNMQGVKVDNPSKGFFIRIDRYADGKRISKKVFIR